MRRPRSLHLPYSPYWPQWEQMLPDHPSGVGHAEPQYERPEPDVMMWVSEGRSGWKSDRWQAVERPQRVRTLGFRR